MNTRLASLGVLIFSLAACGSRECPTTATSSGSAGGETNLREPTRAPESLTVTLGGLGEQDTFANAQVFSGFGCQGDNRSPALDWSGAPEGTQSFAVIIHDPDAPTGVGFFHWVLLDVPANITHLDEGASFPEGVVQAHTDFGSTGYGGPCPPPGAPHRYEVTVYAVDVPTLGLGGSATGALARFALGQHTLAIGRAVATYSRSE